MLSFALGGLFALGVFGIGVFVGVIAGETVNRDTLQSVRTKPSTKSGSLKRYSKQELANLHDKAVTKMGSVLDALHDDAPQ